jgi:hypothetical protein
MANSYALDPWFGCELWTGSLNSSGYGTHWVDGKPRLAHVVSWERAGRALPPGHDLDHLCRRRRCRALAHLELVTKVENMRRKRWSARAARATCAAGHELFMHGRRTPEGGVVCRICSGVWRAPRPGGE